MFHCCIQKILASYYQKKLINIYTNYSNNSFHYLLFPKENNRDYLLPLLMKPGVEVTHFCFSPTLPVINYSVNDSGCCDLTATTHTLENASLFGYLWKLQNNVLLHSQVHTIYIRSYTDLHAYFIWIFSILWNTIQTVNCIQYTVYTFPLTTSGIISLSPCNTTSTCV